MSKAQELKCCPFCGREAMMSHSRDGEVCNVRCAGWSVGNCLGAGPNCYTEAEAITAWNRRAPASSEQQAAQQDALTQAARDVLAERQRQVSAEGWTPESDDRYEDGVLSDAGAAYALMSYDHYGNQAQPYFWPWEDSWWKPGAPRRNLEKAGALILAEIERLDRAAARASNGGKA